MREINSLQIKVQLNISSESTSLETGNTSPPCGLQYARTMNPMTNLVPMLSNPPLILLTCNV